MKHKYDIGNILSNLAGYKGQPFSLGAAQGIKGLQENYLSQQLIKYGAPIYAKDHLGRWYFLPVSFKTGKKEIFIPYAILHVRGKKIINKTPMAGNQGSVKELIATDDYEISITGMLVSHDGTYPEDQITQIRELYNLNESVDLVCALTDLILDSQDQVVIESIEYPPTPGVENGQAIKLKCITDRPFELIIE